MKKCLLFVSVLFVMESCAVLPKPSSYLGVVDYSPLTKSGIYVTESNSVNFEYVAIGSVIAEEIGGYINGAYVNPNIEVTFNKIVKKMKDLGANGIINLRITFSSHFDASVKVSLPKITISGMAIKTKDISLPVVSELSVSHSQKLLGEIDSIKCWILEKTDNGMRISTEKELTVTQIKRVIQILSLNANLLQFNLLDKPEKDKAYAGISDGYIVIYETNEFISLKE